MDSHTFRKTCGFPNPGSLIPTFPTNPWAVSGILISFKLNFPHTKNIQIQNYPTATPLPFPLSRDKSINPSPKPLISLLKITLFTQMEQTGRMYQNLGTIGMLGLEMPLHPHHPPATGAAAAQMVDFSDPPQIQLSMRQSYPYSAPPNKPQPPPPSATSDDDEPGGSANDDGGSCGKRKVSPWHRMKWTDTMVKLLIMAVYYIGDEAGTTSSDGPDSNKKQKLSNSAAAGGLLQKKGKWKSVSRAMMEKGYCVSPQQCEDKFNDLNKRYKRVNDILGRGTACRVVENQTLLESMDLSPKLKEEVRKLLNSKHLFFREMCAYHNSCGHGSAVVAHHSPESAAEKHNSHLNHIQNDELDEEEDEEEEYEDEEENHGQRNDDGGMMMMSAQLKGEMISVISDVSKSAREKQQWVGMRMLQLEEAGLKYQSEAFEIEKQRLKWAIYSSKKEREMERMKIDNERRRLENQRMLLLLRQKELEMSDH